ncbi:ABC transporter ATP-binding protein [Oceanobacillus sp. 1P07AA]
MEKKSYLTIYFWVISFYRKYIPNLVIIIILGATATSIQLAIPKGIGYFIDEVLPSKNYHNFFILIASLSLLIAVMILIIARKNLISVKLQEQVSYEMQFSALEKLRRLGLHYYESHSVGEILSLMNTEVLALQKLYRSIIPKLIEDVIFSIVAIIFMFTVSIRLTIVLLPMFLLYFLVGPYFEKKAALLSNKTAKSRILYNKKTYESISSVIELRAIGEEKWNYKRLRRVMETYLNNWVTSLAYAYLRGSIRRFIVYFSGVVSIFYGIYLVRNNLIGLGNFTAFLLYYFQSMTILTEVITGITQQKIVLQQAVRLYEFFQLKTEPKNEITGTDIQEYKGHISLRGVNFSYPNSNEPILRDFSTEIKAGEKVVIVGPSGSGKTTLLKLIGGLYEVNGGELLIDSVPIERISYLNLRDHIGYVFQENYLFGSTVYDNILFGKPDATEGEVFKAAKAANAHEFIMELPRKYKTIVGEKGSNFSGGQKQRISIARMILKNPSIILLDEITSSLDRLNEEELIDSLTYVFKEKTIISVSHSLNLIKSFDRVLVLDKGRLVQEGEYYNLVNESSIYYDLVQSPEEERGENFIEE